MHTFPEKLYGTNKLFLNALSPWDIFTIHNMSPKLGVAKCFLKKKKINHRDR